jgi:tetratricopeptide (TPR) repeat protein
MADSTGPSRWLQGPAPDLLFGCGGLYAAYFVAALLAGPDIRSMVPLSLLPLGVLVLGAPHYGATLLRVYERSRDRRDYRLFGVWASLAVAIAFVVGVYNVAVGSWMLTLYLSWSPWHYSGQNYGIASMFLGRRGVNVGRPAKRVLQASFQLSWLLVLLAIHAAQPSASYAAVTLSSSEYSFISLGIPIDIAAPLILITAIAYLGSVAASIVLLRQAGSWRDIAPTLALIGLQALWFSIPVLARATSMGVEYEPLGIAYAEYTFYWIAFGHFIQYLWVTVYYAKSSGTARRATPYLGKALLAGSAIWGLPLILFSPEALGVRAFDAGLGTLIASAVNIHHFILDGAIWKLRDGRIARILLRGQSAQEDTDAPKPAWARVKLMPVVLVVGLVSTLSTFVGVWEVEFGFRRAALASDVDRLRTAAKRLRWAGRDHPGLHTQIALFDARAGRLDEAILEIERSLELQPSAEAWRLLGKLHNKKGDREEARRAFKQAKSFESNPQAREITR